MLADLFLTQSYFFLLKTCLCLFLFLNVFFRFFCHRSPVRCRCVVVLPQIVYFCIPVPVPCLFHCVPLCFTCSMPFKLKTEELQWGRAQRRNRKVHVQIGLKLLGDWIIIFKASWKAFYLKRLVQVLSLMKLFARAGKLGKPETPNPKASAFQYCATTINTE